jgi:hypothetical protein
LRGGSGLGRIRDGGCDHRHDRQHVDRYDGNRHDADRYDVVLVTGRDRYGNDIDVVDRHPFHVDADRYDFHRCGDYAVSGDPDLDFHDFLIAEDRER